jgi:DNA-binding MarR family transcriptional regulator
VIADDQSSDNWADVIGIDRLIHEPARLVIMAILYAVASADFLYLLKETKLTKGNLSSHLGKLEEAGYVHIEKTYEGKTPRTILSLTDEGHEALDNYRAQMKNAIDSMTD